MLRLNCVQGDQYATRYKDGLGDIMPFDINLDLKRVISDIQAYWT